MRGAKSLKTFVRDDFPLPCRRKCRVMVNVANCDGDAFFTLLPFDARGYYTGVRGSTFLSINNNTIFERPSASTQCESEATLL